MECMGNGWKSCKQLAVNDHKQLDGQKGSGAALFFAGGCHNGPAVWGCLSWFFIDLSPQCYLMHGVGWVGAMTFVSTFYLRLAVDQPGIKQKKTQEDEVRWSPGNSRETCTVDNQALQNTSPPSLVMLKLSS